MITVLPWVLAACAVIWVIGVTTGILILLAVTCREAWTAVRDWWLRAHAVIEETQDELGDQPVPYWPASELSDEMVSKLSTIVFCPACHPGGDGKCTCVAYCGDRQCTFGYTARLSAEEAAWLRQLGIKEGTDQ